MTNLKLQQGETILLQTSGGCYYTEKDEIEFDELFLTNKHIIYVCEESKGFFSSKTETHITKIPLVQILVVDGVPQVEQVKDEDYGKTIQIIYENGNRNLFEIYNSPKKQLPIWKTCVSDAVLKASPSLVPVSNEKKHQFCVNCGAKLQDGSNFCSVCGCPVRLDAPSNSNKNHEQAYQSVNAEEEHLEVASKTHDSFNLTITEKRYSIRKSYTIHDTNGNVLYTAKSEGLPKMPEIVVYKKDKQVGRIEKELFAKPFWGNPEYTLHWNGKKFASLQRKRTLKRVYDIPEKGWRFEFGVMTSKLFDRNDTLLMTMGRIISSGQDRYSVEYYDIAYESAAVLFALIDAMTVDLE